MYNATKPTLSELPTSKQLLRSTLTALVVAIAILVTVVLPSEYSIDPTGIGRVLGLTEMGEIKAQLAKEAAADASLDAARTAQSEATTPDADAPTAAAVSAGSGQAAGDPAWRDEMRVVLQPGEGAEVKLGMKAGERAPFRWTAEGGVVNFDLHGEGADETVSYEKGRAAPSHEGVLEARFDGNHGWFWRNRGNAAVTVVIRSRGQYADMKRVM